jgi:hypothetical protein
MQHPSTNVSSQITCMPCSHQVLILHKALVPRRCLTPGSVPDLSEQKLSASLNALSFSNFIAMRLDCYCVYYTRGIGQPLSVIPRLVPAASRRSLCLASSEMRHTPNPRLQLTLPPLLLGTNHVLTSQMSLLP